MAEWEKEETCNLHLEFEWVLQEEVRAVLNQLQVVLLECVRRFPVPLCGSDGPLKQDKFVMSTTSYTSQDVIKCVVSIAGDNITQADINVKIHKPQNVIYHTGINPESPWKLQQIQDAGNHLQIALFKLRSIEKDYTFKSAEEVQYLLSNILGCLQRGRNCLVVPKKKTIEDLMNSRNMKSLSPALPGDLAVSFYVQSHKLVLAVYHLSQVQGTMKFDTFQAECSVLWLNDIVVLFTVALQLAQQLKDKISVFSQYKDFAADSRSTSALS